MSPSFQLKSGLIILLAVLSRLAFVAAVDAGKLSVARNPDSEDYLSFAHNLATGVGFAHAVNEDQPFSQPVEFSAWRTPLFPMFLAAAFQISRNTLFLRSLQVVLAGCSVYFLMGVALILFGESAALISGLVFALYPLLVFYTAELETETLFVFLLTATLLAYYRGGNKISSVRAFLLGVLTGLAALDRPNGLMLIPAFALAFLLGVSKRGEALWRAAVLVLAAAIVVLPWTYRNYRLYHEFVLISSNEGANLWFGAYFRLVPGASMEEIGYSQHRALRDVPEPERDKYYYHQALAILDHSPQRWGEMFASNFAAMYTLVPSARLHSLSERVSYTICYVPLLVTGMGGWLLLRRRWRELSLLWAWVLADTALYCIYISSIRYRVASVDPILILGTGVLGSALLEHWRRIRESEASAGRARKSKPR